MLKFVLGGAGCGKSTMLADKINDISESDKKVIVIVPEQFSFDSDKKLYKRLGCKKFNRILSLSFTSLAKEIFEKYGSRSNEYADDISKLIIMKKAVKKLADQGQLHFFARQIEKPDFIIGALDAVTEFRRSGISADEFSGLMTGTASVSEKTSDLSLIYFTYNQLLEENGLRDSLTDISEAAAIAEINGYFKDTVVFFDEFESFTGDEYYLIESIIAQADQVYVSLRLDNTEKMKNGIFESVKSTWRKFYQLAKKYSIPIETENLNEPLKYRPKELAHLNKNILRSKRKNFGSCDNIRIAECSDLYEEADWICSEIKRLVREENYLYSDIAVISRQMSEYSYIFEAAFEKYDIPFSTDEKKSVMHTSIMQYVSGIVEIVSEKSFSSETIFKYAKTSLSGISMQNISELENYCFEWNIDGNKWSEPFETGMENYPSAEKTRQKIIAPLSELKDKCRAADCRGICTALFDFVTEMEVQKRVAGVINSFKESGLTYLAKEFKRLWDIFTEILESLAQVGGEITLSEFNELFTLMLRNVSYSVPPQTLDSVNIAHAETARPGSPKVVFLAGANEGCFPPAISQSGLLNESDRLIFEQKGISLSRKNEELIADERLIVYKTLTYASEKLYITYPLSDSVGTRRFPAAVLKQITGMFGEETVEYADKKNIIEYCSTPKAAYVNLVRLFGSGSKESESIKKALLKNKEYEAKIKFLESVDSEKNLEISDTSIMHRIYSDRLSLSASAIEEFNTCHFKYFCHSGLKLRIRKKRIIDKIGEGNLTHKCLEEILRLNDTKEKFDNLTHEQIKETIEKCSREFLAETFGSENIDLPDVDTSIECICTNIETLIKHLQKELKQSEFRPAAFELDISEGNDKPVLKTENGIEIYLNGSVDRIDTCENEGKKYLRVIDYKTGQKSFSIANLLYGINMQMILYMFSVTGKNGRFNGYQTAGALYMPSGGAKCSLERESGDFVENHLDKHYKMNGVVLKDRMILNAMEKEIKGVYIPAAVLASDDGSGELKLKKGSSCLTKKNFERLREYTDEILLKMCRELYDGKIHADPFVGETAPCDYCDYWSVCGNTPEKVSHSPSENAENDMMEILGGDENE